MRPFTICNAHVHRGDGSPPFRGWLSVAQHLISGMGAGDPHRDSAPCLDAGGLALAPGFVDLHGHTDVLVLANPTLESKLLQGVTTELGGNCGLSIWPPCRGQAEERAPWEAAFGLDLSLPDLAAFKARLAAPGLGANYALLAGHGNLRAAALGYAARPAAPGELELMAAHLQHFLRWGAWGLSFGLAYLPGMFADADELAALGQGVRGRGFLAFHLRSEGDQGLEAVAEALEVGRRCGVPVHLSHHKALGRQNWGRVAQSLALMEEAAAAGQEVTADVYPYTATCTSLASVLPNWAHEGGTEAMLARLRNGDARPKMAREMAGRLADRQWLADIMISRTFHQAGRDLEGATLADLVRRRGVPPEAALFDLLLADRGRTEIVRLNGMSEADVELVLRHPRVAVASDATARALSGPLAEGKPHPRAFGTFPRVLGRYVRERGTLSLPEALRKMTSLPAARLGLVSRGLLQPGCHADLVLFDPATINDQATFAAPVQAPEGIIAVWVNGRQAVADGRLTGALAGRLLLRSPTGNACQA